MPGSLADSPRPIDTQTAVLPLPGPLPWDGVPGPGDPLPGPLPWDGVPGPGAEILSATTPTTSCPSLPSRPVTASCKSPSSARLVLPDHPRTAPQDLRGCDKGLRPRHSTRSVDDLVRSDGRHGDPQVRGLADCAGLDETVGAFRTRTLAHAEFPYSYLDATCLHVRNAPGKGGQVVSMAVVVATGVTAAGEREIMGPDVGDSEGEIFWRSFLLNLEQRGLSGDKLVISDQHSGLVKALGRALQVPRPTLPGPLRPQFAGPGPQRPGRLRGRGVSDDPRPTHRRGRPHRLGQDPRRARRPVPPNSVR